MATANKLNYHVIDIFLNNYPNMLLNYTKAISFAEQLKMLLEKA
jgi:hypothetical protein